MRSQKLLSKRLRNDGVPTVDLNPLQKKQKKIIENKIKSGIYSFEHVPCVVCKGKQFQSIGEKDRYGLYFPVVACEQCGFVQTNPRMTEKSYAEFYDTEYRKLYIGEDTPTETFFEEQRFHAQGIYQFLQNYSQLSLSGLFIVEIGAGAGGIVHYFQEKGNTAIGYDLGSEYIAFGKKKGIHLKVGTIKELKKLKRKPDLVIYSHVAEHLMNPVEEFTLLKKYLHSKSEVYIEVPGIKNLLHAYGQNLLRYFQNAHTYHFTLRSLLNCMHLAGYELVKGNEGINALFRILPSQAKTKREEIIVNEYSSIMGYLKRLETIRKNPFNQYRFKNFVKVWGEKIVTATGTRSLALKLYHYRKYRK